MVHRVIREIRALYETIVRVYSSVSVQQQPRFVRWQFPRAGFVALNTDGSSLGNPGLSGFGGVVRDSQGRWLFGFAGHLGVTDCLRAELVAILYGLDACWHRRYRKVELFTDSLVALGLITKPHSSFHHYAAVVNGIKSLLQRNWDVTCHHLLREGNAAADHMAKMGAGSTGPMVFFDEQPPGLTVVLEADRMGTLHLRM